MNITESPNEGMRLIVFILSAIAVGIITAIFAPLFAYLADNLVKAIKDKKKKSEAVASANIPEDRCQKIVLNLYIKAEFADTLDVTIRRYNAIVEKWTNRVSKNYIERCKIEIIPPSASQLKVNHSPGYRMINLRVSGSAVRNYIHLYLKGGLKSQQERAIGGRTMSYHELSSLAYLEIIYDAVMRQLKSNKRYLSNMSISKEMVDHQVGVYLSIMESVNRQKKRS